MTDLCPCGEPHHTEADYELAHGDRDYALYLLEEEDHDRWFDQLVEGFAGNELTNEDRLDVFLDAMGVTPPVTRPALQPRMDRGELALLCLAGALIAASTLLWASTAAVIAAAVLALS